MTPQEAIARAAQRRPMVAQPQDKPCKRCVDGLITAALGQLQVGRKNITDKEFGSKYDDVLLHLADLLKDAILLEIKAGKEEKPVDFAENDQSS